MNMSELAEQVMCPSCRADVTMRCRTSSGAIATMAHAARIYSVNQVWLEGYADGIRDALDNPDFARRWLK